MPASFLVSISNFREARREYVWLRNQGDPQARMRFAAMAWEGSIARLMSRLASHWHCFKWRSLKKATVTLTAPKLITAAPGPIAEGVDDLLL